MSNQILNLFPMSIMIPDEKYKMTDDEKKFINDLNKEGNCGGGQNEKSISSYILENKELKKYTIKSIKADDPVWFGCDVGKFFTREFGVMDTNLFEFDKFFWVTNNNCLAIFL